MADTTRPTHGSSARRRVSRWDRPKPPKDWRYWVGGFGRVLITLGLLMFAFVAYQLWGTGIQTAQAQNRLDREFDKAVAANTGSTTIPTPPTTPQTTPGSVGPLTTEPRTATTSVTTDVTAPSTPALGSTATGLGGLGVGLDEPPQPGNAMAKLVIPRIALDWIVVQGVDRNALKDGPGHFPESPLPGEYGNVAIAGHRTTHGEPFADIDVLQPGDDIYITDLTGQKYHYRVIETVIVKPTDYQLLVPAIDPFKPTMTLITCNPRFSTSQRLAVRADMVLEDSPPPRMPTFYLPADPNAETGLGTEGTGVSVPDTTAVSTPSTTAATTPDTVLGQDTVPTPDTVPLVVAPVTTPPVAPTVDPDTVAASQDAFSAGWFSDPGAWPQVGLWGAALLGWCLLCYLLARVLRRVWVGLLMGFAPFVVLLYFWFENVNRLLPPNL